MYRLGWLIILTPLLASPASAPVRQEPASVRIVLVGDSTVTDDSGWGLGFKQLLSDRVVCINTAANGRSSKSFIDEGRWQAALAQAGDYYVIQFGHNDQPGKGADRETDPATTFPGNIRRFVDDVRAKGAIPVLVTSLARRTFDASGRTLTSTLTPWVNAVKSVGDRQRVVVIDLAASSAALSERLGQEALYEFSPKTATGEWDTTHLNAKGSLLFGRLVIDELRRKVPSLAPYLRMDPAPAESIHIQTQDAALPSPPASSVTWDQAQVQPAAWYATPDAGRIARNVVLYQRTTGGWAKNVDMAAVLSTEEAAKVRSAHAEADSTIDNGATTGQLRYLATVYAAVHDPSLRAPMLAGVDYLLAAQYPSGGWPQYYPLRADYSQRITFNDDAMVRVMRVLDEISRAVPPFDVVDADRRARSSRALARAVDLTLRLQIRAAGGLTGWAQQYDERTLAPAAARTYEHPSIASRETVGVVRFLMGVDRPTPGISAAVDQAVEWLRRSAISGIRIDRRSDPSLPHGFDLTEVPDPSAPTLWARFYAIDTNRPIYSGRDGVIRSRLADIEVERRTGYSWIGPYAQHLLSVDYPAWVARIRPRARSYTWRDPS